jgi:predicted TIM-barrel fold metal-dependent hydrolase
VTINDAHCHFFSSRFLTTLAAQRRRPSTVAQGVPSIVEGRTPPESAEDLSRELQWDQPGDPEALADRWVQELDRNSVARAALIGSVPGDEDSVAAAVARHPSRLVGFFMLDPSATDASERTHRAFTERRMRAVCLFPAMHQVRIDSDRVLGIVEIAAAHPGSAVFVHCGVLSVGVRRKLGLPSPFDLRLGDPLALQRLASSFPAVRFIVPHFGAGVLREALILADQCPNVYFDTSSSNNWIRYIPGLTLAEVFRASLSVMTASRLLFGTDSSFFPRGWQRGIYEQQRQVIGELGLSEAETELIFSGNFDRLFAV